jgi:MOSC domain-containing protein YiiM
LIRLNIPEGSSMSAEFPDLLHTFPFQGRVEWIGIAPEKSGVIQPEAKVEIQQNAGIVGDHHFRPNSRSRRQVTLIQSEHLPAVAAMLRQSAIDPGLLRRNIVVSGINLASLHGRSFRIGKAVLRGTGDCIPCDRMEQNLGAGGYAAMLGHGGLTTVVVESGHVAVGDVVEVLEAEEAVAGEGNSAAEKAAK